MALLQAVPGPARVLVDISRVQGPLDGVGRLCTEVGAGRVAFGTNLPLTDPVSPLLSLHLAALTPEEKAQVAHGNARRLLA